MHYILGFLPFALAVGSMWLAGYLMGISPSFRNLILYFFASWGAFHILDVLILSLFKSGLAGILTFIAYFLVNIWLVHIFFETEDWEQAFLLSVVGGIISSVARAILEKVF